MWVKMPEAEGDRESERDSPLVCGESKPPCSFAPSIFLLQWHKFDLENVFSPFICWDKWSRVVIITIFL